MPPSAPAAGLTAALQDALQAALETVPTTDGDTASLAGRIAPVLAARVEAAAKAAGASLPRFARALTTGAGWETGAETVEHRVLAVLRRHSAGRSPGLAPDSLSTLTGIPQGTLGPAVSRLVQAGELVRDAWLVRLPGPDDLLAGREPDHNAAPAGELRHLAERRAIGDRRALGERRLYDRRSPGEG